MTDTVGARLPDPDQVVVPDLPAAIVAYRAWVLDDQGWLLSPMFGRRWPTSRPLDARCEEGSITAAGMPPQHYALPSNVRPAARHRYLWSAPIPLAGPRVLTGPGRVRVHPVPCPHHDHATHRGHGCGLYGIRDARELAWRMPAATGHDSNGRLFTVWGEVWLSGQVLEYSDGYRASRATPKALWRPTTPAAHAVAERAAERYGIPVIEGPEPATPETLEDHLAIIRGAMVSFGQQFTAQLQASQPFLQRLVATGGVTPPVAPAAPPRHRRRRPPPRRRHQPAAAIRRLLARRHARRWCGGAAAAAALLLPAWRRGDLLWWHDRRTLLAAAGTGLLAAAITYGARALHLTRILRKDGPDV